MATNKTMVKKSAKKSTPPPTKRWSAKVKTDSTKPGPGLFKQSAKKIADEMVKKSVSPKGPGQAMQMLSFYENRAGKNLPAERKKVLEEAKDLVREKEGSVPAKKAAKKASKKATSKKATSKKAAKKPSVKKESH